ncbi:GntR family transcriptional regulator [Saccharothrix hoggarensis]|uniref:GntR family transcriptional regulator n=1 Tax=Saccharothrix hoggarensis TaxID=913853 RepID=A0ABW3QS92_9PSEU
MPLSDEVGHPYQTLARSIIRDIDHQVLSPGDKLPSVRDLAKTAGTTIATTQRALALLASEGYVKTVPGLGSFVLERVADDFDSKPLVDQVRQLHKDLAAIRERLAALESVHAVDPSATR